MVIMDVTWSMIHLLFLLQIHFKTRFIRLRLVARLGTHVCTRSAFVVAACTK